MGPRNHGSRNGRTWQKRYLQSTRGLGNPLWNKQRELMPPSFRDERRQASVNVVLGPRIEKGAIRLLLASGGYAKRREQHLSLKQKNIRD